MKKVMKLQVRPLKSAQKKAMKAAKKKQEAKEAAVMIAIDRIESKIERRRSFARKNRYVDVSDPVDIPTFWYNVGRFRVFPSWFSAADKRAVSAFLDA